MVKIEYINSAERESVPKLKLCQFRKIWLKENKNGQVIYKYIQIFFYQKSEMFAKVFPNCLEINFKKIGTTHAKSIR